jgi:hypothetical protein
MSRVALRSASWVAACCLSWSLSAGAQSVTISDAARQHFEAGVHFMQDPDGARYEEAYREFKAAYAASPSWKILGNLGIAAMKLERDGEAIEAFQKYLEQGKRELDRSERDQFQRDLAALETSVVWVTFRSVPEGATLTDERVAVSGNSTVNRYAPLAGELRVGLRSGQHRVTARLKAHEDAVWELEAASGSTHEHTFELVKVAPEPAAAPAPAPAPAPVADVTAPPRAEPLDTAAPIPLGVYIGLGVTGALAVGTGVTAILATSKGSEFEEANDGSRPARAAQLKQSGERLNLITDVLLGGTVVAGAVSAFLYFTRPESAPPEVGRLEWTPVLSPSAGALSVSGWF